MWGAFPTNILMKKNYKYLTFIPAKKNSTGLKNKNLRLISGKKLIEITINFIKKSKIKNNYIFVSTDSKKISKISSDHGANVDFLRSKKLSKTNSILDDAIFEFLNSKKFRNINFEFLILLMPTQPLRSMQTFLKAVKIINNKNFKSIISVKNLYRSDDHIFKKEKNILKIKKKIKSVNRQFIKSNFTPCGCFYITSLSEFKKNGSFYNNRTYGIETSFPQNLDIDNIDDLYFANSISNNKKKFKINI